MKQVILKSITLRDWKSLNVSVDFSMDGVTTIEGRNGIGKSSIYHAWLWLLTGYTMAGETKNADLYDHRKELSPETPEACVCATLITNGEETTIERRAKAKFVRKRGTDIYEKAPSDEYTLYVDNIETSVSMFEDTIKGIFEVPSTLLPYLLSGEFFSLLASNDIKKARTLLEEMTHEIPIEEMSDMDYTPLKEKLGKYNIEQLKEQSANALAPLKQREHDIPIKIEQEQALIASYRENDFSSLAIEIEQAKHDIKTLDERMMGTREGMEEMMKVRNEAIKKRGDMMQLIEEKRVAYEKDYQEEVARINREIADKRSENARMSLALSDKQRLINNLINANKEREMDLERKEKELEGLRNELNSIKARVFDNSSLTCKYCGQELPYEKQNELMERFEEQKARDREANVVKGKAKKDECEKLKESIEFHKNEIEAMRGEMELMPKGDDKTQLDLLEKQIEDLRSSHMPFSSTNEYATLKNEMEKIEIPEVKMDTSNDECKREKSVLMDKLEQLNRKYGLLSEVEKMEKDIASLENEKEEVGRHIVAIEQFQALIAAFEEERARRVSEQINSRMEGCKIRMWRTQKDGQRVKDCVITNGDGVTYNTTNFSDRISINMQLQRLFCEYYRILLPTFVDEAYAFDSYHTPKAWEVGQQVILLKPSDDNFMNVQYK